MDVKNLKIGEFLNVILDNNDEVEKMACDFSKNIFNGRVILTGKGTGRTITLRKCETITANTKRISIFMDFLNSNFISLCISKSNEYKQYILETLIGINLLKYIQEYYAQKLCDIFIIPFSEYEMKNNNREVSRNEMIRRLKEFNELIKSNGEYNLFYFISDLSDGNNDSFESFIKKNYPYLDLLNFDIESTKNKAKLEEILLENYRPRKKGQLIEPILRFMRQKLELESISLMIDNFDLVGDNDPDIQKMLTEYFSLFDNVVITTDSNIDYSNEIFRFEQKGYELVQFGYGRNANFLKKIIFESLSTKFPMIIPINYLDNDIILNLSLIFNENIEYLISFFYEINILYFELISKTEAVGGINKYEELLLNALYYCLDYSNIFGYKKPTLNLENKYIIDFYENVLNVYKNLINDLKNQKKPILYI